MPELSLEMEYPPLWTTSYGRDFNGALGEFTHEQSGFAINDSTATFNVKKFLRVPRQNAIFLLLKT
jgi:hypothetical protein